MKKLLIKNKNKCLFIVILLSIIILFTSLAGVFNINYAFAQDNYVERVSENFNLDTDKIAGSDLSIRDYSNKLHATKSTVSKTTAGNGFILKVGEDDPIVKIVPKDKFFTIGQVLEIGDEYGYFINTTQNSNGNYLSTVLVFDITTNTNLEETIDRVIINVNPIFQYKYIGLTNSSTHEEIAIFDKNGLPISSITVLESGDVKYSFALRQGENCCMFFSLSSTTSFTVLPDENYI